MNKIDKIVQALIVNGTLVESSGLLYGETGVAHFFLSLRQTENKLNHDFIFYNNADI